jgi:molybdopterin converting factor subunit 1
MKIQLLFFGITTDLVGEQQMQFQLTENASVNNLKTVLISQFPALKNLHEFAIAVNESYVNNDFIIKNGDVVAIIPPVSGG